MNKKITFVLVLALAAFLVMGSASAGLFDFLGGGDSNKVTIGYLGEFKRGAKALRKKYPSFQSDYDTFLKELEADPFGGEPLGHHTYKYRMAIASKGKGKSGGSRVLTYNIQQQPEDEVLVTLMTIYDKSDISNVSDNYIRALVQQIEDKK